MINLDLVDNKNRPIQGRCTYELQGNLGCHSVCVTNVALTCYTQAKNSYGVTVFVFLDCVPLSEVYKVYEELIRQIKHYGFVILSGPVRHSSLVGTTMHFIDYLINTKKWAYTATPPAVNPIHSAINGVNTDFCQLFCFFPNPRNVHPHPDYDAEHQHQKRIDHIYNITGNKTSSPIWTALAVGHIERKDEGNYLGFPMSKTLKNSRVKDKNGKEGEGEEGKAPLPFDPSTQSLHTLAPAKQGRAVAAKAKGKAIHYVESE